MGLEKIVISKEVSNYFEELIFKLHQQEYFGFLDSSIDYVDEIIDFIFSSIAHYPKKNSPHKLKKYGRFYLVFKMNNTTSWYIFFDFDKKKNTYLIKAILNNHLEEIKFLNL